MKCCSTCKLSKLLTEFPKDKRRADGAKSECKLCHKERNKRLYIANRERYLEVSREYKRNNPEVRKAKKHREKALQRNLPHQWTKSDIDSVKNYFSGVCSLTGSRDIHFDHFIPLATGHGGSYTGNMITLDGRLNESKQASNPFEWIKTRIDVDKVKFNKVVDYLAEINGLTVEDFRSFVYWCFDNTRTPDEVKRDKRHSVDIWKEIQLSS